MTETATEKPIGLCLDCDYPLQHLQTNRCPECGREFDPADPKSMNMGRKIGTTAWWWIGPVSRKMYAAIGFGLLLTLWYARLPNNIFQPMTTACLIWAGIAMVWLAWPALSWIVVRYNGWPRYMFRTRAVHWVVMPALIMLMVWAVQFRLPLQVSFRASKPAMDDLAKLTRDDPAKVPKDKWVGVFHAKKIWRVPGGMKFTVEETESAFYRTGFIYLPDVDPRNVKWPSRRYMGNGWWLWREEG